jgi:hypothetical protein
MFCAGIDLDDALKLAQIAFYLATPIIAAYGLVSWKSELRGRAEYEVATNVLAGAYRVRDAIRQVQSPFMTPREWTARERREGESEHDTQTYNSFYAFANRFGLVRDAIKDWYPHVVRGEALFETAAKRATDSLAKMANKLWVAIEMWHQHEIKTHGRDEGLISLYNIMYGIDPAEHSDIPEDKRTDNGFHADFKAALAEVERVYRPHVARRKSRR